MNNDFVPPPPLVNDRGLFSPFIMYPPHFQRQLRLFHEDTKARDHFLAWKFQINSCIQPAKKRKVNKVIDMNCDQNTWNTLVPYYIRSRRRSYGLKRLIDGQKEEFPRFWHKVFEGELDSLFPWKKVRRCRILGHPLLLEIKYFKIAYTPRLKEVKVSFGYDCHNISNPNNPIPYYCPNC